MKYGDPIIQNKIDVKYNDDSADIEDDENIEDDQQQENQKDMEWI